MERESKPEGGGRGGLLARVLVVVVVVAALAGTYHAVALAAFARTFPGASTADRLAAAQLAEHMEPWDARFQWRVVTLVALQRFEQGQVDAAYFLLLPLSTVVRGDDVYRSVYREIGAVKGPIDSRKAHVQHGHEQVGGILLEPDVQH